MKKICLLLLLILLFGCSKQNDEEYNMILNVSELTNDFVKIYELGNNSILYSEFKNIYYLPSDEKNNKIDLKNALEEKTVNIDEIISKLELVDELNDGGSKLYISSNNISNIDFYLARCNKIDGNKNIYISLNENVIEKCRK